MTTNPLGAIAPGDEPTFDRTVYGNIERAKATITSLPKPVFNYCLKRAYSKGLIKDYHKDDQIQDLVFAYYYSSIPGSHRNKRRKLKRAQGQPSFGQLYRLQQRLRNIFTR